MWGKVAGGDSKNLVCGGSQSSGVCEDPKAALGKANWKAESPGSQ